MFDGYLALFRQLAARADDYIRTMDKPGDDSAEPRDAIDRVERNH